MTKYRQRLEQVLHGKIDARGNPEIGPFPGLIGCGLLGVDPGVKYVPANGGESSVCEMDSAGGVLSKK